MLRCWNKSRILDHGRKPCSTRGERLSRKMSMQVLESKNIYIVYIIGKQLKIDA